jgi:hypothetical protein
MHNRSRTTPHAPYHVGGSAYAQYRGAQAYYDKLRNIEILIQNNQDARGKVPRSLIPQIRALAKQAFHDFVLEWEPKDRKRWNALVEKSNGRYQ